MRHLLLRRCVCHNWLYFPCSSSKEAWGPSSTTSPLSITGMRSAGFLYSSSIEINDARKRLEKMAGELQSQYAIKSVWAGNKAILSGIGLKKGVVELTDSAIKVEITLGMLAKAMKDKIESQVNTALDKALPK